MKDDYLRQIFIKCVAAILGSQEIRIDRATFDYIVLLAELRMQEMFSDLAQIIKVQRHTQPGIDDVVLWLTRNSIDLIQNQRVTGKHVDQLNSLQFDFDVEDITKEQEVFFDPQLFHIKKIVPSTEKVPSYAPEWSPALPPDHTYMATADYPNRVRGLQELHEKLFEEGHMAELALQRLLGSKGSDSAIRLRFPRDKPAPAVVPEAPTDTNMDHQEETVQSMELPQPEKDVAHLETIPNTRPEEVKVEEAAEMEAAEMEAAEMEAAEMEAAEMEAAEMEAAEMEAAEMEAAEMEDAEMEDVNAKDIDAEDAYAVFTTTEDVNSTGNQAANTTTNRSTSQPGDNAPTSDMTTTTKVHEDEQAEEQEVAPKPYITIVNSEPAPEPPANDKPLSLKINLPKPKRNKVSQRPKVDIVEMARNQELEQKLALEAASEAAEECNLETLLEKAMASVDA